ILIRTGLRRRDRPRFRARIHAIGAAHQHPGIGHLLCVQSLAGPSRAGIENDLRLAVFELGTWRRWWRWPIGHGYPDIALPAVPAEWLGKVGVGAEPNGVWIERSPEESDGVARQDVGTVVWH